MRRSLPVAIAFIMGTLMIIQFFVPHPVSMNFYRMILDWRIVVGLFMFIIAWRSLVLHHLMKIRLRRENWQYSIVTLVSLVITAFVGIVFGIGKGSFFSKIYDHIYAPMDATMFSLLAFFIASAAFRAFRARNLEATLLLIAAVIVMLGRVPVGDYIHHKFPQLVEWILMYPNMAAQRGIRLGVGLGMIATSLKIILGIERQYLGGGD